MPTIADGRHDGSGLPEAQAVRVQVDQAREQRRVSERDRALGVDVDVLAGARRDDLVAADRDGAVLDQPLAVEEPRRRDEQIGRFVAAAAGERRRRDQRSETPDPSTTRPTRHAKSFRDSNSACNTGALSAGSETSSPPAVCGS